MSGPRAPLAEFGAAAAPAAPNPTNRGAEIGRRAMAVGVGWLEGTYWVADRRAALGQIGHVLGVEPEPRDGGYPYYELAWDLHPGGSYVGFSDRRGGEMHFVLKQQACEHFGRDKLQELAEWQSGAEKRKFSRMDLAANDQERRVSPQEVYDAYAVGDAVTRIRAKNVWMNVNAEGGQTAYFGSPKSEHRLRVYDKDVEQEVQQGTYGIRWENQCRNLAANDLAARYFGLGIHQGMPVSPTEAMWSVTRRLVDFRDRSSAVEVDDRDLLPWWRELVGTVGKADLPKDHRDSAVEQLAEWLRIQVAPSLARVVDTPGYGERFVRDLLAAGRASDRYRAEKAERRRGRLKVVA